MFVTSRHAHVKQNVTNQDEQCSITKPNVKCSEWSSTLVQDYLARRSPTESVLDTYRTTNAYYPSIKSGERPTKLASTKPPATLSHATQQIKDTAKNEEMPTLVPSKAQQQQIVKPTIAIKQLGTEAVIKVKPAPPARQDSTLHIDSTTLVKLCKVRKLFINSIRAVNLAGRLHANDKIPPNYSHILCQAITRAINKHTFP